VTEIGEKEKYKVNNKLLASIVVVMLLIGTCAMAFSFRFTPKVSADTMYYLEVKTQPEGIVAINGTGWYTNSSTVHLDAPLIVDSPRYRFVRWNVDGVNKTLGLNPINVPIDNKNHTAIAIYIRQYHLTMSTGYEFLGVLPWIYNGSWYQTSDGGYYDSGSTVIVGISGLDGWDGVYVTPTQWVYFVNFTVSGRVARPSPPPQYKSDLITMTSDLAVTVNWRFQYMLYVRHVTDGWNPTIPGQGWYWENTVVTLTAPPGASSPPPPAGQGFKYVFDKWEVVPDVLNVYFDQSVNVTMNTNKTATAYYHLDLYLLVWDWPYNKTDLYTYTGWYTNCTHITLTAPDAIYDGPGIRYIFTGWWKQGLGYFTTDRTITIPVCWKIGDYLPLEYQACYEKVQYYLTVTSSGSPTWTPNGTGWYNAGTVVPLTAPDPVLIDSGSRYKFDHWLKNPGGYTDTNNATTITMNAPRTAIAYYNLEHKLKVDDDQGSSYGWSYWWSNGTNVYTGWWYVSDLGGYTPSMPTLVFHHWTIIQGGVSTDLDEGVNDIVLIDRPTTLIAHFLNETFIILAAGSDVEMEAPGAYGTTFDVDVIFANFESARHIGGKAMDLYGAEFNITWDAGLIELTGYTPHLGDIWPTGSYIQSDEIGSGYFFFAAHAINTYEGFSGTKIMLTLHFRVVYEPCYNLKPTTTIKMSTYKLANHLDERIYPEHVDWCSYRIHALKPKLVLEPSIGGTIEYINEQNRIFTVDVKGYNLVKIKDYTVIVEWDPWYLKCLGITFCDAYFTGPFVYRASQYHNDAGWLEVELELDITQGAHKVNGTAVLFTITFEIVLDQHYEAWWAPDHQAYKIDIAFDRDNTKLSGQCEPYGLPTVYFTYGTNTLNLIDADPWYAPHIGDLNYDGHIDLDDLMLIRQDYHGVTYDISWGQGSTGIVDIFDAVLVALNLWAGPLD
jgi:hypothetical protein